MQNNDPSLEQKLYTWLETQGYPLEMRVARAFQVAGARVIQSEYYSDVSTKEFREIDIVAHWQDRLGDTLIRVTFVIECKSSKDKPWVLFVSPDARLASPARVAQRAASRLGRRTLSKIASEHSVQNLPIFRLPDAPGYSITQAFTSGKDLCYSAASSVANASLAQANEADVYQSRLGRTFHLEIIFPVLVTEARLFMAALQEDSSVKLTEQSSGVLLWRNPIVGMPHTIIHVISLPALAEFVAGARESAEKFITLCDSDYRKPIEEAKAALAPPAPNGPGKR